MFVCALHSRINFYADRGFQSSFNPHPFRTDNGHVKPKRLAHETYFTIAGVPTQLPYIASTSLVCENANRVMNE